MAKTTSILQIIPWNGGRNTTIDPSLLANQQLSIADNVVFSLDGTRRKRGSISYFDASSIGASVNILGIKEYWANVSSTKSQRIVAITDEPKIYYYTSSGVRAELTLAGGSTALVAGFDQVSMEVIDEDLIMAFNNNTTPKKWSNQSGTEFIDLPGTPPNFTICREHKGRLFAAGVRTSPDRLYYTTTGNNEEWNGTGDSGAIDIAIGDGDAEGITAIFPSIKGQLFVAKRDRLYRVDTTDLDDANWSVTAVSKGIGCIGHSAVTSVGQDDIVFMSDRGLHTMSAVQNYGDFESQYMSTDIQKDFLTFNRGRFKQIQLRYLPELNSIMFSVSEDGYSYNNHIHLYNIIGKQWYRWPNVVAQSIEVTKIGNQNTILIGNNAGRISVYDGTLFADNSTAIRYQIKTGMVYPDGSPMTVKGFKKVSLFYKPKGDYTITAYFKIDNYLKQELSFDLSGDFDALGTEFLLGSSTLGFSLAMPIISLPVDGYGHGFSLELIQDGLNQDAAIYGFAVEYEQAGDDQEAPELE